MQTLPSWQEVTTLQPDLLASEGAATTFAAAPGEVWRGCAPHVYQDAAAFFGSTFPSDALCALLGETLARLQGQPGERILRLQSGFGGGKSHALLTLYHALTAPQALSPTWPLSVPISPPPQTRVAVFSGLDFDPQTGLTLPDGPTCLTLWGALAWQVGGTSAWEALKSHDQQRIAPGGATLQRLLTPQPTALLMDELLLYVEKTRALAVEDSNFGRQNLLFLQTLTEVVQQSPAAVMIYALQTSAQEAAGDDELLVALERLSNRLESHRTPLAPSELFEVLRRRLFASWGEPAHHEAVARQYLEAWRRLKPAHKSRQRNSVQDLEERAAVLARSYPFHPSLLTLLTEHWWSLPSYQRTRGALQLLAQTVLTHHNTRPGQLLLTPDLLPLEQPAWRNSWLRQMNADPSFENAITHELLSPQAPHKQLAPTQTDPSTASTTSPAEALTRTLMLYSFGGEGPQSKGLLKEEWCLHALHPAHHPAAFLHAQSALLEQAGYLHHDRSRYRFRSIPNLRHELAQDTQRWTTEALYHTLKEQLQTLHQGRAGVVLWPETPADIPDQRPILQRVYLAPSWMALDDATRERRLRDWWEHRTPRTPRIYRNGLVFLLPSATRWPYTEEALRQLLSARAFCQTPPRKLRAKERRDLTALLQSLEASLPTLVQQLYHTAWLPPPTHQQTQAFIRIELAPSSQGRNQDPLIEALANHHQLAQQLTLQKLLQLLEFEREDAPTCRSMRWLQDAFFRYLSYPRVADLTPVEQAIREGIQTGMLVYQDKDGHSPTAPALLDWSEQATLSLPLTTPQNTEQRKYPTSTPPPNTPNTTRPSEPQQNQMTTHLQLSLDLNTTQWQQLQPLLDQLSRQADHVQLQLQLQAEAKDGFSPRWLRLTLQDTLEELGLSYSLKSESQDGK